MSFVETGKEFLEHYGIKGMRWGVRRTDKELARARRAKAERSDTPKSKSDSSKNSRGNIGKRSSELSDKQLKDTVARMQLEQQYARMTPKSTTRKAVDFAVGLAQNAAKQQMQQLVNQQMTQQVGRVMKQLSDVPPPPNRFPSASPRAEDRIG